MIKATVNNKEEFEVDGFLLNGSLKNLDIVKVRENTFHVLHQYKSYNVSLINYNEEEKVMVLNINGNNYEVSIRDKNDLLLQKLGIRAGGASAVQHVKAPMPGLIISVSVNKGDEVKKGDTLLILEAMKMENVIKSPRDGKIKSITAELKKAVEKNQVLVEFE